MPLEDVRLKPRLPQTNLLVMVMPLARSEERKKKILSNGQIRAARPMKTMAIPRIRQRGTPRNLLVQCG